MKTTRKSTRKLFFLTLIPAMLTGTGNAMAQDEALTCKLYITATMDSEASSNINMEAAGFSMVTTRRAGFCLFPDGRIADKQFVFISREIGDGSTGSSLGYSVYTLENGDTLTAEFSGAWDSNGFKGTYNILNGTGRFRGAGGDGTIAGTQSPWETTEVLDIVLNVQTP